MFGALSVEDTSFFSEVIEEVTAFHKVIPEPESFSSGFFQLYLCSLVHAGFPV